MKALQHVNRLTPLRAILPILFGTAVALLPACSEPEGTASAGDRATASSAADETAQNEKKLRHTNRLIDETSPYLLLHAHNPVDWYPWGTEAFEKAKEEGKLIFLSIGYSSCYWCHVMERESFSDPEIAKTMNEHFVCIKVDREERPDLDDVYMTALNLYFQFSGSQQSGGWPLSMFLTPEGNPIAGGTYFPPEDRRGMPGFPKVLQRMRELWTTQRDGVEENAAEFANIVRRAMRHSRPLKQVDLSEKLVDQVKQELAADYDEQYGGFGATTGNPLRPKFPEPSNLLFLLREYERSKDEEALAIVRGTLDAMARGGIRDHLGGGFHRYSTDPQWRVPHFEKMLYDNAQLADAYVKAYAVTDDAEYRRVAEEIFAYIEREMTGPEGGFYTALDAETDEEEGKYYVWTAEEIERALGEEDAELFNQVYGLSGGPNFEQRANVLLLPKPLAEVAAELEIPEAELRSRLAKLREQLLKVRDERPRPLLDDKVLTAWNGLMIRALANGGRLLDEPRYTQAAARGAEFVLAQLRDADGRLLRTYRKGQAKLAGYLDDYAFLIEGLLALHDATGDERWLDEAVALTDICLSEFSDDAMEGFYFTSNRHEKLLARTKDPFDSVLPSGNSVMAANLLRLAEATGEDRYRERAAKLLESFAPLLDESPTALPNMAVSLGHWLDTK